jgi:hypothetical protein
LKKAAGISRKRNDKEKPRRVTKCHKGFSFVCLCAPSWLNYLGSPVSGGKKDDELFLCHRLHRFSPIFLLKSAQIRETPHWRAAQVFVAVVFAFPLKTVEPLFKTLRAPFLR